ncbi:hypothetical protein RM780_09495 [Streptomyces sp. DSM 44917]|uniref:PPM-type phosphatase domain-containing protein n=1 Tax=Streptomyces boetiae TaxID=3075541 RepID=A0ABU2L6K1_9ACTN|nr:hypothetical protein [Streptomyces sp. DSM 44917]MDT0307195.1 hypothetical protein [Streptomyces sp. DSM 44917]
MTIQWGAASRRGVREVNADASAVHQVPGTGVVAAAIVDGIGSSPAVARMAAVAAEVAARVGARRTPTIGILAAAELVAATDAATIDPEAEIPDGVAVLAVAEPGHPTAIAWTGDARAWGWDGRDLRQLTTDHTVGEYLRHNSGGGPIELLAAVHDNWVRASLGQSSIATVHAADATDPVVLLTSDGVHDSLTHADLTALVRDNESDPDALTAAIVAAVSADPDGYRDDATAIALRHTT